MSCSGHLALGGYELDRREVSAIAADVSGEDRPLRDRSVRAYEEVWQYAVLRSLRSPVREENLASEKQGISRDCFQFEGDLLDYGVEFFDARESHRKLGVDDGVNRERIGGGGRIELILRPWGPLGVILENIEQDVGVDERHSRLAAGQRQDLIGAEPLARASAQAFEAARGPISIDFDQDHTAVGFEAE